MVHVQQHKRLVADGVVTIKGKTYVLVKKKGVAYQAVMQGIPVGDSRLDDVENYRKR